MLQVVRLSNQTIELICNLIHHNCFHFYGCANRLRLLTSPKCHISLHRSFIKILDSFCVKEINSSHPFWLCRPFFSHNCHCFHFRFNLICQNLGFCSYRICKNWVDVEVNRESLSACAHRLCQRDTLTMARMSSYTDFQ